MKTSFAEHIILVFVTTLLLTEKLSSYATVDYHIISYHIYYIISIVDYYNDKSTKLCDKLLNYGMIIFTTRQSAIIPRV